MNRFWLIEDRIASSLELKQAGLSPLRAVDLGRCDSIDEARAKGKKKLGREMAIVIAHNVRIACDFGHGARWGLSGEQIDRLRQGEKITLEDSAGRFTIGCSRIEDQP